MRPLISVIVPVYNVEKYLRPCVDSILAQTYQNLEIILINDGSTDKSGQICDEYATKDKRVRVIHQANQGVSVARNAGLEGAKGQYIGFVDGDDWIDIETYQTAIGIVTKEQVDFIKWGYYKVLNDKQTPVQSFYPRRIYRDLDRQYLISDIIKNDSINNFVVNCLFKKTTIENFSIRFLENLGQGEDLCFLVQYLLHADAAYLDTNLYYYYYRQIASSATKKYTPKYLDGIITLIQQFHLLFEKNKNNQLYLEAFNYRINKLIFYLMLLLADGHVTIERKVHILNKLYLHVNLCCQNAALYNSIPLRYRLPVIMFHKKKFYTALFLTYALKLGYLFKNNMMEYLS